LQCFPKLSNSSEHTKEAFLSVAGHTAGSMMYLANGVLFFGDAATGAADGHIKAPPGPFSDDVNQGVASLHALATTLQGKDVKTFAFAHSGPMPADLAKITAIAP
jgi:glyoxylase-like metal-dependent hydrolase (beta-lactamase superfamily II)